MLYVDDDEAIVFDEADAGAPGLPRDAYTDPREAPQFARHRPVRPRRHDYNMPGMSGLEARALREIRAAAPVAALRAITEELRAQAGGRRERTDLQTQYGR